MLSSLVLLLIFALISLPLSKRIVPFIMIQPKVIQAIETYGKMTSSQALTQYGSFMVAGISLSCYPLVIIGGEAICTFYFVIAFVVLSLVSFLVNDSTRPSTLDFIKKYAPQLIVPAQAIVATVTDETGKVL